MSKVFKYATDAELMDISITYNGKTYKFNLASELKIDEVNINNQLKRQPTSYAFLSMLLIKLEGLVDNLESSKEKLYNQLYVKFKTSTTTKHYIKTQKFPSDDLCKSLALSDIKYSMIVDKYLSAKGQMKVVRTAVRGFEQRAFLIQTLSANNRKQI